MTFAVLAKGAEETRIVNGKGNGDAHAVGNAVIALEREDGYTLLLKVTHHVVAVFEAHHKEIGLTRKDLCADGELAKGQYDFRTFVYDLSHPFVHIEAAAYKAFGIVGHEGAHGMGEAHTLVVLDERRVCHNDSQAHGGRSPGVGEGTEYDHVGMVVNEPHGALVGRKIDIRFVHYDDACEEVGERGYAFG